jgi:hypothetical protein
MERLDVNESLIGRIAEEVAPLVEKETRWVLDIGSLGCRVLQSHAYYVQEQIRQKHFRGALIESHFNLATLLMRLFGGAKLSQYTEAVPSVAAAASRGQIGSLYRNL